MNAPVAVPLAIAAGRVTILEGDVREVLRGLPSAYFDCVVTSPPYWGLRDYGVEGQIGLERTLGEHLEILVSIFREIRRVLKAHGTVWLNYGDCYAAAPNGKSAAAYKADGTDDRTFRDKPFSTVGPILQPDTRGPQRAGAKEEYRSDSGFTVRPGGFLKPKDLCMIPNRLAIALQDDGWWVRSEIIWHKPNPMPESTYDRPTSAHEKVWLLTKSENYFYNHEAIREPVTGGSHARAKAAGADTGVGWGHQDDVAGEPRGRGRIKKPGPNSRQHVDRVPVSRKAPNGWDLSKGEGGHGKVHRAGRLQGTHETPREPGVPLKIADEGSSRKAKAPFYASTAGLTETRNARNVWTISPRAYREAHFACVDQETECLTAAGWLRHESLEVGMLAAQFDLQTSLLSWAPVQDIARYQVEDQGMVVGSCRDMDMWLTPNHRTVVQRRHPTARLLQAPVVIRADELKASHSIPTAAEWLFEGDASVPCEWAELLGWYVAEGHQSKDSLSVELYQSHSVNLSKCARIEELLRQVGAEWTKATCQRIWRGRDASTTAYRVSGYAAVRLREMAPGKLLPVGALLWSKDRVAALVDGLVAGDGHTRLDGRRAFIQKNLQQCDLFQALCLRLGYSATRSVRSDGIGVVYVTTHRTRSFRGTSGAGSAPIIRRYTGTVWCPKLPNGTWIARRGGKPFITGNTFPPALATRCLKAGVPALACSFCGHALPQPTCHGACQIVPAVPGRVLDPFGGAGTVGLVAQQLGVDATLIELNPEYVALTKKRLGIGEVTSDTPGGPACVEA